MSQKQLNVLGQELVECSCEPMTGFFRDGKCRTDANDYGSHTVCAVLDDAFLDYTVAQGNDLKTPRPEFDFPGLKAGDHWCLCALRWLEAYEKGVAPRVCLESTNLKATNVIPIDVLKSHGNFH